MPFNQERNSLQEFALALQFFGRIFTAAPDRQLLAELVEDDMFSHWPLPCENDSTQKGIELLTRELSPPLNLDETFTAIHKDFFELFEMSPPGCYVHESVYLGKDPLFNESPTFAVQAFYAEYGLLGTGRYHGPEDHIGLEMSFVGFLLNDPSTYGAAQTFYTDHLMRWAKDCLICTSQKAATPFYKGVAAICLGTLTDLEKMLCELS